MTQTNAPTMTILDRLAQGDVLISDGATGSYLQQHGLGDGDPEEWNATHPDVVQVASSGANTKSVRATPRTLRMLSR